MSDRLRISRGTDLLAMLVAKLAEQNELLAERDQKLAARDAELAERTEQLAALEADKEVLTSERDGLRRAYEQLKEELLLVKRRLFVAKAERVDTAQLELEFAELSRRLNALAGAVPDAEEDGDETPTRKRKPRPKGRRNLAEADLPEVSVEITDPLFEELAEEGKAERVGAETSYKLGYERGGYRRIATHRIKYRVIDGRGESSIETAPLPPELLRRCLAAPSTLAHLAS